ncbi:MAG TPA: two-component regulator propeller domain-containing protein [Anaerolineae bacterium]|nr:two-component regulator propeller domain-containing protein [Anaerolineae bacterium]
MPEPVSKGKRSRLVALIAVVLLAALLRGWAALRLPVDYDEPTYLEAAFRYARALEAGDLAGVIDNSATQEHPPLVKFLYGLVVRALGDEAGWTLALYGARVLSALFGVLAVLVLGLVDPAAAGMMAVHTLAIKYSSQAYLEALPFLASLVSVLALVRVRAADQDGRRAPGGWFWLSAIALGVTAAGKYTYLPVVLVLLYVAVFEKRTRWHFLLLYFVVSIGVFWLLNPTLWREPVSRLFESLVFHIRYSQGSEVQSASLPWYQPLLWLSRSAPSAWHPDVFFYPGLDAIITLLALAGLYWEWRDRRWVVVWIAAGLLFLLVWPTKWPQYTLIVTPALCLAASFAVGRAYRWLKEQELYWEWFRQMVPKPPLGFWVLVGVVLVAITIGYSAATLQLTMARLNWSHFTSDSTRLPSDTVYALLAGENGQMVVGTDHGMAVWSPPAAADLPDQWTLYTAGSSPLPDNSVRAVARDKAGRLWVGTEQGLASLDGSRWVTYRAAELGLPGDQVHSLAVGSDGRIWVGTETGVAVLEGEAWVPLTTHTSGLSSDQVLALAVEPAPEGDRVWLGTRRGVSRLDTASGQWVSFPDDFDPTWGGVAALTFDSSGLLWAATSGGGLGRWDGTSWEFFRTSNSDIPFNSVSAVAEVRPGVLWVGTALPAEVGGELAEFDGQTWSVYDSASGFSGAEALSIAQDSEGRWWIGTRTAGVDIYHARQ